jgi:cobalt-zinc-cadmium efflux system protein
MSPTPQPHKGHVHHGEGEAEESVLKGLRWAIALAGVALVIEGIGAYFSRSLSLTVDAVHNVPDIIAYGASLGALMLASRGADSSHTYGMHRTEVMAALLNAALVIGTAMVFGAGAIMALLNGGNSPFGTIDPIWLVFAAVPTLALRGFAAIQIGRIPTRVRDINLRSVLFHLASDIVIVAFILAVGITLLIRPSLVWVDPVATIGIAAILLVEAIPIIRDSWDSFTERMPKHISMDEVVRVAAQVPYVEEIHDVHIWSVCSSLICMTAHVRITNVTVEESMYILAALRERMTKDFGIVHAVFEVETSVTA